MTTSLPIDVFRGFINEAIKAEKWLLVFFNDHTCPNHDFLTNGDVGDSVTKNFVYKFVSKSTPLAELIYETYRLTTTDGLAFVIVNPFTYILAAKSERITNIEATPRLLHEFIEVNGESPFTSSIVLHFRYHQDEASELQEKPLFAPKQSTFNTIIDNYEQSYFQGHKKFNYVFRGRIIKGTDTPNSLNMQNHAIIDVFDQKMALNTKFHLILVCPDGHESESSIKSDRKVKDWLKTRCKMFNLSYDDLVFTVNGAPVDLNLTPSQLNIPQKTKFHAAYRQNAPIPSLSSPQNYPPLPMSPLTNVVNFSIRFKLPNQKIVTETVSPIVPISDVLQRICKTTGLIFDQYVFRKRKAFINVDNTPITLGLKSYDLIEFVQKTDQNMFQQLEVRVTQPEQPKEEVIEVQENEIEEKEHKSGLFSSCILI